MILNCFELGFNTGISCIRTGHFFPSETNSLVCATQNGDVKLITFNQDFTDYTTEARFDLTENGAIWSLECVDTNLDGFDELIIGGMQGAVICISPSGEELWVVKCESAISGIHIWHNHPFDFENPAVIIYSLDRTIRVVDGKNGHMIWAQMFASGVACVVSGDINKDNQEEIVAGGNDGTVRAFDGKTGKILWFIDTQSNVRTLAIIENTVIIGGDNKIVQIIDGMSHEIINTKEFPTYIWKILPVPSINLKNVVLITTFSFRYLDMDDAGGEPSVGLYHYPDLTPIWETEKVNAQDINFIKSVKPSETPHCFLTGETSGMLSIIKALDGGPLNKDTFIQLPSVINTLAYAQVNCKDNKSAQIIAFGGCDDSNLYSFIANVNNMEE